MESGRSTIDLSKGQNEWEPSRVSPLNIAMASMGVTVCLTTAGLHEIRTNPASVKRQVAHPCSRWASNHVHAAEWCTWLGQARAMRTFTSGREVTAIVSKSGKRPRL